MHLCPNCLNLLFALAVLAPESGYTAALIRLQLSRIAEATDALSKRESSEEHSHEPTSV